MESTQWELRKATASIFYKKGKEHSLLPFPLISFASAQTKSSKMGYFYYIKRIRLFGGEIS